MSGDAQDFLAMGEEAEGDEEEDDEEEEEEEEEEEVGEEKEGEEGGNRALEFVGVFSTPFLPALLLV